MRFIAILAILNVISALVGLSVGSSNIGIYDVVKVLTGDSNENVKQIVLNCRLPRLLLAMLVGSSLATAGCSMQAFFRNPLADPYILGISSGACVGVALVIILEIATIQNIMISAFLMALITAFLVYKIGSLARFREQSYAILLAGIAISCFMNGLASILIYLASQSMHLVVFWIMGSFSNTTWNDVFFLAPVSILCILFIFLNSWNLNAILMGDEHAKAVGLDVERFQKELLAVVSLLTASAVAVSGIIGFVGIIIPHTMRLIVGESHQTLIPATILFGSAFMPLVDVIARTTTAGELPVGAITAMLGAPFFVYLLLRGL